MDIARIKVKFGEHEFEAEGPPDSVQSQFEAFREMISTMPRTALALAPNSTMQAKQEKDDTEDLPHIEVEKVLHVAGRVVSLTEIGRAHV